MKELAQRAYGAGFWSRGTMTNTLGTAINHLGTVINGCGRELIGYNTEIIRPLRKKELLNGGHGLAERR